MPTTLACARDHQGLALGPCSLECHGSAAARACGRRPGPSFLKLLLLTQTPELIVKHTHVVLGTSGLLLCHGHHGKVHSLPFGFRIPHLKSICQCDKERSQTGRNPGLWASGKGVAGKLIAAAAYPTSSPLPLSWTLVTQRLKETGSGREVFEEGPGELQCHLSREVSVRRHFRFPLPRSPATHTATRQRPDGLAFSWVLFVLRDCVGWRREGHC